MTDPTFTAIKELIFARWPALRQARADDDAWPPVVRQDFARAVKRLAITPEQADAALGELAVRCRSKRPFPRELIAALENAQGPKVGEGRRADTPLSPDAEAWRARLDCFEARPMYQRLVEHWLIQQSLPWHWKDITGSMLDSKHVHFGSYARQFLEWVAAAQASTTRTQGAEGGEL